MEQKRWITQVRPHINIVLRSDKSQPCIELDESYETSKATDAEVRQKGLKLPLYRHQAAIVSAMRDLETTRTVHLADGSTVECCAGVLSDPVGSGKTVDILALILLQKYPRVLPDIITTELDHLGIIMRRKFKKLLKPTIVFVGISVVDQWIAAIARFTSLKCWVVDNVVRLENLLNMMARFKDPAACRTAPFPDIILVKNGRVSRQVKMPPGIAIDDKNKAASPHIYNIMANMHEFCWARVVIDDFDTIGLPPNASIINGLFTWYISSTKSQRYDGAHAPRDFNTTTELLIESNHSMSGILSNRFLFNVFNLRNTKRFILSTNELPCVRFYRYMHEDPIGQYAGMLNDLGAAGAEIVEMLNSDSPHTAAERAGIKSTSVADIFQRMLGKEYNAYIQSRQVLEFIKSQRPRIAAGLPPPRAADPAAPHVKATYTRADLLKFVPIEHAFDGVAELLDQTEAEFTAIGQKAATAIQRVKDNIKDGTCPICYNELSEANNSKNDKSDKNAIIIFKCCGVIVCQVCTFGMIIKDASLAGRCAKCRRDVTIRDLIYITSAFDTDKIMQDQLDYGTEKSSTSKEEKDASAADTAAAYPPKIKTLLDIITCPTDHPAAGTTIAPQFDNVMLGTKDIPANGITRKILVFGSYNEGLQQVYTHLHDKVKIYTLMGSHEHIRNVVEQFRAEPQPAIMTINSVTHCSGLNLQFATDLVFMHQISSTHLESQVLGRAFRLGRACNLTVHYLVYKNEAR